MKIKGKWVMPAVGQRITDYTVINLNSIFIVYIRKRIPSEDGSI